MVFTVFIYDKAYFVISRSIAETFPSSGVCGKSDADGTFFSDIEVTFVVILVEGLGTC